MKEKIYSVYIHINNINGKVYIGITCQNPLKRWLNGKGYVDNKHFYRSIKKYGWDNFEHKVIKNNLTKDEAENMEMELIKEFQSFNPEYGYNVSLGGSHNGKHSEQTRKKYLKFNIKKCFVMIEIQENICVLAKVLCMPKINSVYQIQIFRLYA